MKQQRYGSANEYSYCYRYCSRYRVRFADTIGLVSSGVSIIGLCASVYIFGIIFPYYFRSMCMTITVEFFINGAIVHV